MVELNYRAELMVERTVKMEQGNELNLEQVRELIVEWTELGTGKRTDCRENRQVKNHETAGTGLGSKISIYKKSSHSFIDQNIQWMSSNQISVSTIISVCIQHSRTW